MSDGSDAAISDAGSEAGSADAGGPCVPDAGALPAPIAYWTLNEGMGVVVHDSSGGQNDGTLVPGLASSLPGWTVGEYCGGLFFDGDGGFVDFGQGTGGAFHLTGSISVSAWYFPTDATNALDMPLVSKRGAPDRGWELYLSQQSPVFDVSTDGVAYFPLYGGTVSFGQWHHAVGVFDADAGLLQLYGDGVAMGTLLVDGGNGVPAHAQHDSRWPVRLGAAGQCLSGASCSQAFRGTLDEVRIWNVALTPEQAAAVP